MATRTSKNKKTIGLISKTTTLVTLHAHLTFLYISLPFLYDHDGKMPNLDPVYMEWGTPGLLA